MVVISIVISLAMYSAKKMKLAEKLKPAPIKIKK